VGESGVRIHGTPSTALSFVAFAIAAADYVVRLS
jgi:hypothetical protein